MLIHEGVIHFSLDPFHISGMLFRLCESLFVLVESAFFCWLSSACVEDVWSPWAWSREGHSARLCVYAVVFVANSICGR